MFVNSHVNKVRDILANVKQSIEQDDPISSDPYNRYGYYQYSSKLNNDRDKKIILEKFGKVIFPNKKLPEIFASRDLKEQIITFYNIYELLKSYYLTDDTIIESISTQDDTDIYSKDKLLEGKQYNMYNVKNLKVIDTSKTPFEVIDFDANTRIITVFLKADISRIFTFPNLEIQFYINDKEKIDDSIPFIGQLFKPKYIDKRFSKYDTIYFDPEIDYSKISLNNFMKREDVKKKISKKQEIFFNKEVYSIFHDLYRKYRSANIFDNLKFFFQFILLPEDSKLYLNKDYTIHDVNVLGKDNKAFSISENREKNLKGIIPEKNLKAMVNKLTSTVNSVKKFTGQDLKNEDILGIVRNFYYKKPHPDERLASKISVYFVILSIDIFKVLDKSKKKVTLKRKFIADHCLDRAKLLDNNFASFLYNNLGLSKNFLTKKIINLRNKESVNKDTSNQDDKKNKEVPSEITKETITKNYKDQPYEDDDVDTDDDDLMNYSDYDGAMFGGNRLYKYIKRSRKKRRNIKSKKINKNLKHNIKKTHKKRQKKRKWSKKYKNSINCKNPKGFSQKQFCKSKNMKNKRR